ncbi:hypothetical protein Cri9333_1578 [Crinalium epipsammum PCC 9333]|uniref:Uncharacterized protein n=1 Tax=Crinalium epipsammum PCC 9333 TaxID=1173022 RepID=K9VWI7_9CYAN|nr:hypothetical protein [Crinalium epipsammum]AFZ12468.1 hypothetical protein Cri9333_1578 [Crinalium epipsammum PCC 9333]
MSFRKPITTAGGLAFWNNIRQNSYFIMQEHKIGFPVWLYKYRILMRENRMEIANSNDISEIEHDWDYLKTHAVPRLDESIDIHKEISKVNFISIVTNVITKYII